MLEFEKIMKETRLIAIIRGVKQEQLEPVLKAIYAGGVRLAEITYDSTGNRSDEDIAQMISRASSMWVEKMLIGAGTVLTPSQVRLTERVGGKFIISPNTDTEVIRETKAAGMVSIPAAMTVSEILVANRSGADYIKVFPANAVGGINFFKAVRGPLPDIKLIAVSGVTPENACEYFNAGANGFGIGNGIVNTKLCNQGKYNEIEENARKFSQACSEKVINI